MKTKEKLICSSCGRALTEDNTKEFDGLIMCESCFDTNTITCDCCGNRIWSEDVQGDDNISLCNRCYDNYYTNCEGCNRIIHNDDACYEDDDSEYPYCSSCYNKIIEAAIKSYNYKPEPIFYGSGNLFMGIELEIDKGGENSDNAESLINITNRDSEHIYCKHDGSIDNGFEIVSHPMTLDYHLNKMNWRELFNKAIEMGYRSHQTQTCGLHIHINRCTFGKDYETQEDAIGRVVFFVENHWNELLKFSRRTEENINRWASRYGISTTAKDTYNNAKNKHSGRYVAVNLENSATVEFRIFRGTLNYPTFIATLQLIDEICYHARTLTDKAMEGMSWSDFVIRILPKKAELVEYLKAKRLYVNEITSESEEM